MPEAISPALGNEGALRGDIGPVIEPRGKFIRVLRQWLGQRTIWVPSARRSSCASILPRFTSRTGIDIELHAVLSSLRSLTAFSFRIKGRTSGLIGIVSKSASHRPVIIG